MRAILAIAIKDLKLLLRDKTDAFFTFLFPLFLAFFFGSMFGGSGSGDGDSSPLVIAVVDESGGAAARSFIADLDADAMLEAKPCPTRDEAEGLVRRGQAIASVVLPKDFESSVDNMFAGGGIEIEAVVDPSRRAESGLLTGKLNELAFRQMAKSFGDPARMSRMMGSARQSVAEAKDISPANKLLFNLFFESAEKLTTGVSGADKSDGSTGASGSSSPLGGFMPAHVTITELPSRDSNGPRSAYAISFPQGVAWGLVGVVMSFASGIARERARGTLVRLTVAPIARRDLLIGKGLGCFLASLAVIVLLTLFSRIILGVTVSEPLRFGVVTIAVSFAFSGLMMLLAGLCQTEGAAQGAGRAVVLILAMIGGGTIPLFFMPKFMATVSSISPFSWAIFAVEGALWRGFSWGELLAPIGVLVGCGVVGFAVGAMSFNRASAR